MTENFAILTHPAIVPIEGAVLFELARWQQKRSLPTLRVDNSTSGKITHYCFGANSGKMARSLKTTKQIYLFISVKSQRV